MKCADIKIVIRYKGKIDDTRLTAEIKNLKHFIREVRSLVDDICADYRGDPRVMKLYKMLKGF